jgi:hypothetical protein
MRLPRALSLIDLGILTVVGVALFLPAREMHAAPVVAGDDAKQFALGLAEARTLARPNDGLAVEAFERRLEEANLKDWAVEASARSSERAKDSPTHWRALLATSIAYVDLLDAVPALDYVNRALQACTAQKDAVACPGDDVVRMTIYRDHLDAGVKSGIDPHRDPVGFRRAGDSGVRQIRLKAHDEAPVKATTGSGTSTP